MDKPFDLILQKTMQQTMQYLCSNIQGCKIGYTQSDEITLLLIDYQNLESCAWFDNNKSKIESISASMATLAFNMYFMENTKLELTGKKLEKYKRKFNKALFDSRAFNIPKEEVNNCFLWRQNDATKNSILSVSQANFSFKEMQNKSTDLLQDMLFMLKGINWNNYPTTQKRGSCCYREIYKINEGQKNEAIRSRWVIDNEIPIFSKDKDYIEKYVFI